MTQIGKYLLLIGCLWLFNTLFETNIQSEASIQVRWLESATTDSTMFIHISISSFSNIDSITTNKNCTTHRVIVFESGYWYESYCWSDWNSDLSLYLQSLSLVIDSEQRLSLEFANIDANQNFRPKIRSCL